MRTRSRRNGARAISRTTRARGARPLLESLEQRNLLAQFTNINFDFGTATSPVAPGWVGVTPTAYSASRGYGWLSTSGMSATYRGGSNPMTSDFNAGKDNTFAVNVPNGVYTLQFILGDPSQVHGPMTVWAEGQVLAQNVATGAGQTYTGAQTVTVTDGQLDVRVKSSLTNYAIDGLQVRLQSPPPAPSPTATASFLGSDAATQGNWVGAYGQDGYDIAPGVNGAAAPKLPSYATVAPSASAIPFTWSDAGANGPLFPQAPVGAGRVETAWYSATSFDINVGLTDGKAHRVSLYAVDWYGNTRNERVDVLDAATGAVLDSRSLSQFGGGVYLSWTLSGSAILRVTNTGGPNAVVSALYFGSPAAATASAGPNQSSTEGATVLFAGIASGWVNPTYTWAFGDGSGATGTLTPQHTYADNGTYTATLTVSSGSTTLQSSTTIAVANVPPTATITGAPATSTEGTAIALGSLVTDPSPVDTAAGFTESWTVTKNGTAFAAGTGANFGFTPDDNGTYVVALTATDKDGGAGKASYTISVLNVAPKASAGGPYTGTSGQSLAFQGSATDPSPVDTATGFLYAWDFGDGSTASGQGLTAPTHVYALAGAYTVGLIVTDKDSGASAEAFASVTELAPVPVVTGPTSPPTSPPSGNPPGVLTTVGLTPGWATFGEVFTEGQATQGGLEVGSFPTQTDVKNLWPDGSIKYAIVTTDATAAGTYPITQAAPAAGSFTPTIPNASVQFTIGGVVYTAALPSSVTKDLWLSGPLATEWRATVDPVDSSGDLQPYLRVVFDTRVYNDGATQLQVTVQDELDITGATAVSYDVDVDVNGQSLFSQADVTQYYLTNWTKTFDLGLTATQPTLDFTNFYAAGALPQYLSTISNQGYSTSGSTFDILGRGGNSYDYMGSTGGRPEIAPYPDWVARYLVYQTPDQYNYLLANGNLAGSWPVHLQESDGSLVSIDTKPYFWLDARDQVPYIPADGQPRGDLSAASLGPLTPDAAHVPSLAYVPYLVTGDRYYADELAQWGNWSLIGSWNASIQEGGRGGSEGIVGTQQVRARAWSLRNLTDAAAYLPDSDPFRSYLTSKVENNLNYYDNYAQTHVTPLGTVLEFAASDGTILMSQWQNNYLAWAIGHANQQGFTGGEQMTDRIVDFQLKLFTSDPTYPREYAAPYYPTVGQVQPDGTWQYFTTMGQIFNATFVNPDGTVSPPVPFVGWYDQDARLSLLVAMNQGLSGATDAYDWLMSQVSDDINNRPGWAIAPKKSS